VAASADAAVRVVVLETIEAGVGAALGVTEVVRVAALEVIGAGVEGCEAASGRGVAAGGVVVAAAVQVEMLVDYTSAGQTGGRRAASGVTTSRRSRSQ